jgi:hypothetical protein
MLRYFLLRAKESSTWAGISVLLSLAGVYLEPQFADSIIVVGTTVAGMALALLPDGNGQRGGE